MALLERKWVPVLLVLALVLGYNGVRTWLDHRSAEPLIPADALIAEEAVPAEVPEPIAPDAEATAAVVHVVGAVKAPGVYTVAAGGRLNDAVQAAGGFTDKADPASINLAAPVSDGQQVYICEKGESPAAAPAAVSGAKAQTAASSASPVFPVSINSGSREALMLLDGIGEKTADKIIDYRETQGSFKTLEELKNVPGIGDKKFEQIKNDIRL